MILLYCLINAVTERKTTVAEALINKIGQGSKFLLLYTTSTRGA